MTKIIRVVDVETSGLPEDEQHGICEIGWVDLELDHMAIRNPVTFFVNPGHPIPPHIRAIHHISDGDVAAAMTPDMAIAQLLKGLGPNDVLAAHKANFEKAFINAGARRWIDTWKVSLRAWPEYVSHSNQSIRYAAELEGEPDYDQHQAMPPHRALPDAYTTAFILRKQLRLRPLDRLIEISGEPGFLTRFNFGKHKGKTFKEVAAADPGYLSWIVEKSDLGPDEKFSAQWHLQKAAA